MLYQVTTDRKLYRNGKFYLQLDITQDVFEFLSGIHLSQERYLYRNVKKVGTGTYQEASGLFTITFGDNMRYGNHDLVWHSPEGKPDGVIVDQKPFWVDGSKRLEEGWNEGPCDEQIENYYARFYLDIDEPVDIKETIGAVRGLFPDHDGVKVFVLKSTTKEKYHITTNVVMHVGIIQELSKTIPGADFNPYQKGLRSLRAPYAKKICQTTITWNQDAGIYIPWTTPGGNQGDNQGGNQGGDRGGDQGDNQGGDQDGDRGDNQGGDRGDERDWWITPRETDVVIPLSKEDAIRLKVKNLITKHYNHDGNRIDLKIHGVVIGSIPCESGHFIQSTPGGEFHFDFEVSQKEIFIKQKEDIALFATMKVITGGYSRLKDFRVLTSQGGYSPGDFPGVEGGNMRLTLGNRKVKEVDSHSGPNFFLGRVGGFDHFINIGGYYKIETGAHIKLKYRVPIPGKKIPKRDVEFFKEHYETIHMKRAFMFDSKTLFDSGFKIKVIFGIDPNGPIAIQALALEESIPFEGVTYRLDPEMSTPNVGYYGVSKGLARTRPMQDQAFVEWFWPC